MRVLIVGGGPIDPDQLKLELMYDPNLIIAADAGGQYLYDIGCFPQILIGDFDSLSQDMVIKMKEAGVEVFTYPIEKDLTDVELSVDLAIDRGATLIRIIGGLGGRIDHTLGNVGLLLKAYQKGVPAYLIDLWQEVTLIGSRIEIRNKPGCGISLIPLTIKVSGVTTTGLKFPLTDADLYSHQTLGIHNEFSQETATVSIKEGFLVIVVFREGTVNKLSYQNYINPI